MEEADCCLPVTKTTTEPSDTCPTEDAIRALLKHFVDPLLPSKPSTSDVPSKSLRESVAKQVHAVVLLYNYYHRKENPHLECLNFEKFRSLATAVRPDLLQYFKEAGPDGDSEQTLPLEKVIVGACRLSMSLDRSSDLSTLPIKKVAVMLVDSGKKNCYLLHSITEDVWSLIEKTIETDTHSGRDALAAIVEATGVNLKHIRVLKRDDLVCSLSEEKTVTRFFIMMYTPKEKFPGKDTVADLLNCIQGPLFKKSLSGWTVNSIVKYFPVLPYASLIKDWFSRREDTECVIDKESKAVCDDDICPYKVVIRALLEGFVDPLIPVSSADSKPKFEVPSMALCESVTKQVHAVVLLYNYFVTKEKPHLECLNFEKFCSLATAVRPDLLKYLKEPNEDNVIVDASSLSMSLDASSDLPTLPIRKVAVMLVESEKKNCYLQHSSITQGVYSLIEKNIDKDTTAAEDQNEVIYQKVAYEAIAEATGVNRKHIEILESHLACSLSEEKQATRFYIMKCTSQDILSGECPVEKLLKCMEGPLFEKAPHLVVNPKAYYFQVLPYATLIKDWFSRSGDTANSGISKSEEPPANLQEFLTDLYNAWDIESLSISKKQLENYPFDQIIRFLNSRGYTGKLTFEAVVSRYSEDSVPADVRLALETRGVRFISVFSEKNQAADEEIKRRMAKWAFRCSSKGLLVLMACDGGYGSTMKFLRKAHPNLQSILIYNDSHSINLDTYPIVGRVTMQSVLDAVHGEVPATVPEAVLGKVPEAAPEAPPKAIHGEVVVPGIDNIVWCYGAKKTCTRFTKVAELVEDGE